MTRKLFLILLVLGLGLPVKAEEELVWTDMSAYPLCGKIIGQTDAPYRRFPVSVENRLPERKAPERIQDLSRCSAGLYIRFRSDAKVLKASWEVEFYDLWPFGHMTDANKRGLDIYALEDGKWVFMGVARPRDQKVNTTHLASNPEGKMREYMLYLSNYDQVKWVKIGHPKGTVLEMPQALTPRNDSPVLVYGTSITQGGCCSRPGLSYTNTMSRILDRTVVNVGLSGNGCFDLPVAEYMTQAENPSCIVIDNMANCTVKIVEERAVQFLTILRTAYPSTPIILVSKPTASARFYNARSRESDRRLNESFRQVYDRLKAAGDDKLYFLDLAKVMNGCEYTVDGVHYTDPGMAELAERISAAVKDVIDEELRIRAFDYINLDYPGLGKVKEQVRVRNWRQAAVELLGYFRNRPEVRIPGVNLHPTALSGEEQETADDAMKHIFHVHGKPYWDYGKDINWEYWPVKDIEKRVFLHRFPMWPPMGTAYRVSGNEEYVREWMRQLLDWERKNPYKPFFIDQGGTVSSGTIDVTAPNEHFVWRPLDTSRRLERFCEMFALLRDSGSITPEFLTQFICIVENHADILMKTFSPAGNHLVHQAANISIAAMFFPEFKHSGEWMAAGTRHLKEQLFVQTSPDGGHFELDPGYQGGVLRSYNEVLQMASLNGLGDIFPEEMMQRLLTVAKYYLDMTYPDWTHPCFSDARRGPLNFKLFRDIYGYGSSDSRLLWFASGGTEGEKPPYKTVGYPQTGFYTFRSGWDKDAVVMTVKATERGMWHAQPDFGTFELWYAGKMLMPDAGCYVYSGDREIERWRAYFKETARHNALTLDDRNYDDPAPKVLKWKADGANQVLSVEHRAYDGLTRRRTVKFVDEKYFIIEDEVRGDASGTLRLRFGLGEGRAELDGRTVTYQDGNSGLKMKIEAPKGTEITLEKDWFSEKYGQKAERAMVVASLDRKKGTQKFVTYIYPLKLQ